jgi:hypothetical protein
MIAVADAKLELLFVFAAEMFLKPHRRQFIWRLFAQCYSHTPDNVMYSVHVLSVAGNPIILPHREDAFLIRDPGLSLAGNACLAADR